MWTIEAFTFGGGVLNEQHTDRGAAMERYVEVHSDGDVYECCLIAPDGVAEYSWCGIR